MVDLSDLKKPKTASSAIEKAIERLTIPNSATDSATGRHSALMARIVEQGRVADSVIQRLKGAAGELPGTDLWNGSAVSKALFGPTDALSRINERIAEQAKAIDTARNYSLHGIPEREPFRDLHLRMPPNPLVETNQRLARIEKQFHGVEKIALDGAKIANDLLAKASHFVGEFEKAAADNTRAARRAIWLAIFAIVATVAQIGYAQFWSGPADAAANEALRQEMAQVRSVIAKNDGDSVTVLRDIKQLLAGSAGLATTKPQTVPTVPSIKLHREGGP
jgi:hypothetical protein